MTLALLWQEGLDKGQWNCSYATFCRWYNQWRVRHQLSMRQVYKGGEKLFVDDCRLTVPIQDKEKVEKAVQEVERQVLAPLRHEQFSTLTDLNAAIAQRLKALNERTMHGYGVSRRVLFEQVD